MFTADTAVKFRASSLTVLNCHFHKLANTCLVKLSEWVAFKNLCIIVCIKELTCIITAEAISHLSKVICTEAEEFSFLSNITCCKSSTRNLNHSTNFILHITAGSSNFSISSCNNNVLNILKFFSVT